LIQVAIGVKPKPPAAVRLSVSVLSAKIVEELAKLRDCLRPQVGISFALHLLSSLDEAIDEERPMVDKVLTGRETILVVDDEKGNATMTGEILESLGYRVLIAGSGREAVAVYMEKGKEVDLVLLDMIMPGMGGGRTFDALRSINPGVKVLLSSGYSADGEAQQILDRGCNGFIQKPFRIANITGIIREVIEK
jgi:two-component system cell cycle sensor histidine kinase/response regulator CckA